MLYLKDYITINNGSERQYCFDHRRLYQQGTRNSCIELKNYKSVITAPKHTNTLDTVNNIFVIKTLSL